MVGLLKGEGNEGAEGVSGYLTSWWLICTIKPKGVWPEARHKPKGVWSEARNKVDTRRAHAHKTVTPGQIAPSFLPVARLKDLLTRGVPNFLR